MDYTNKLRSCQLFTNNDQINNSKKRFRLSEPTKDFRSY